VVQTVNGCGVSLNGGDRDTSAATGACARNDLTWGVRSQGVELEASANPSRYLRIGAGVTYAQTRYNEQLAGNSSGAPLDPVLRVLPGKQMSNAPEIVVTTSLAWTPPLGGSGMSGLVYVDSRTSGDYNTGSDLFPQKGQDGFSIVNARLGVRGPDERWSIELWAQNLFNKNYAQVAFNSPFQAGGAGAPFVDPQYPGGRQIFSQFLAEPRTFGATARVKF
jgi:outer membrane receptor protein involved in Fe transport